MCEHCISCVASVYLVSASFALKKPVSKYLAGSDIGPRVMPIAKNWFLALKFDLGAS